jgi:hypothetical protein
MHFEPSVKASARQVLNDPMKNSHYAVKACAAVVLIQLYHTVPSILLGLLRFLGLRAENGL